MSRYGSLHSSRGLGRFPSSHTRAGKFLVSIKFQYSIDNSVHSQELSQAERPQLRCLRRHLHQRLRFLRQQKQRRHLKAHQRQAKAISTYSPFYRLFWQALILSMHRRDAHHCQQVLLIISCSIVFRSFVLRRRYQRRLAEALAVGAVLAPRVQGSRKKRFRTRPKFYDTWISDAEKTSIWADLMVLVNQSSHVCSRL